MISISIIVGRCAYKRYRQEGVVHVMIPDLEHYHPFLFASALFNIAEESLLSSDLVLAYNSML